MEEKKLTDEEIAKAILQQVEYNAGIPYIDEWLKVKTVEFADILNFIYRLQDKADGYERKIENGGLVSIDWHNEQVGHLEEENAELKKQVDELKAQLKSVQSACQSKNGKIKTLNSEKEALQNELNFQNGKPHYRYVIWNTKQNKRQFPSICELTESGAYTKLFQKIGWDSAKYRFEVRRIKVERVEVE